VGAKWYSVIKELALVPNTNVSGLRISPQVKTGSRDERFQIIKYREKSK
jgi:hypothetical protein